MSLDLNYVEAENARRTRLAAKSSLESEEDWY